MQILIILKKLKCSTVISTFSEHIAIFWILSIDIWQLKCQQRQTNKTKHCKFLSANLSELSSFSTSFFWEKPLWNQKFFLLTATAWRSCYTLVRPFPALSCFPLFLQTFLELIFAAKIKTMLSKQPTVKKILRILCIWTLKILFMNKRLLT